MQTYCKKTLTIVELLNPTLKPEGSTKPQIVFLPGPKQVPVKIR